MDIFSPQSRRKCTDSHCKWRPNYTITNKKNTQEYSYFTVLKEWIMPVYFLLYETNQKLTWEEKTIIDIPVYPDKLKGISRSRIISRIIY